MNKIQRLVTTAAIGLLMVGCTNSTAMLDKEGNLSIKMVRSTLLGSAVSLTKKAVADHKEICNEIKTLVEIQDQSSNTPVSPLVVIPGLTSVLDNLKTVKGIVGLFPAHTVSFSKQCMADTN